jgi:hypothetical protein
MSKNEIQNLLQHVGLIRQKYEDFAEITGENFNVFDILNVSTNEMSHSSFVCFLLDVKAKHGQKDLFLKLFINQIKNLFEDDKNEILIHFDTLNSHAITEKSIGNKSEDVSNGGRIDIIINDGKNNIIIENKIYASDQEKQMMRYYNYDSNAPLIYLSLGDENPSEDSISHSDKKLEINKDFISISYRSDIKKWIEECVKAVYDKPLIRETLRQYVFLINELTNQSNNKKMSEEIVDIMKKNINDSLTIYKNIDKLKFEVLNRFGFKLVDLLKIKIQDASIDIDSEFGKKFQKIRLSNNNGSRFLLLSFLSNYEDSYIEIHPGRINDKIIDKDSVIMSSFKNELQFLNSRSEFSVQNTQKAWQGEWVAKYSVLNNCFDQIYNSDDLLNKVADDICSIYEVYNKFSV